MRQSSIILLTTALVCLIAASGCQLSGSSDATGPAALTGLSSPVPAARQDGNVFRGPAISVGHGAGQAWVALDGTGEPTSIGISFTRNAFKGLPDEERQMVFLFHDKKNPTQYTHMLVDWNPNGHEPPGVYDVPHFDFHFYWASIEDRMAIGPNDDEEFANAPPAEFVPSDYLQTEGGVPQMGAHWVDLQAPEFNGQPFTETFIWGSYDGEFIFIEPMITIDVLTSGPDVDLPVRQPQAFQHDGYYPTHYRVTSDPRSGAVSVILDGLTYHEGEKPRD